MSQNDGANEEATCSFAEVDGECKEQVEAVLKYLDRAKIKPGSPDPTDNRFIRIPLPYCPFKGPEHTDGRTAILIWRDGTIGAKCFHEKCKRLGWADMQDSLKLPFDQFAEEAATVTTTGQTIADMMTRSCWPSGIWRSGQTRAGTTLVHFLGDTYRFDKLDGWQPVKSGNWTHGREIRFQAAFDEHASMVSKMKGKTVKPKPVRREIVSNTVSAMESLVKRQVSVTWQSPFWLQAI